MRKTKVAILLIALRNGLRQSEAIEAFNLFHETGQRRLKVRVRKRGFVYVRDANGKKKRASNSKLPENPIFRDAIIPDEVDQRLPRYDFGPSNLSQFGRYAFGLNPHALRHCFVSALGRRGVAPQVIARITQHATLTEIIRYTEEAAGSDLLEKGLL